MAHTAHIQLERIGREYHVSVMGGLNAEDEREALIAVLQSPGRRDDASFDSISEIHITFFEAETLTADIIEALKSYDNACAGIPVKIFVFHKHLSSYLNRLGIHNKLIFGKSLVQQSHVPIKALAIGGSAESLDKIFTLLSSLPLSNITIFIVQHFPKDARNILDHLLQDRTRYTAMIPADGQQIEERAIYIAPSDYHMLVEGGRIRLTQSQPVNYARPSIDVLFQSAAREYGEHLVAVLLCGYGSDGSQSLESLRVHKCRVLVEDPLDCSARDMPRNGLRTGNYDYKFPIQELLSYLSRNIANECIELEKREIQYFLADLHAQYGYDYENYSLDSITRRLQKFMQDQKFATFSALASNVLNEPELFEDLFLTFSINVTHFFRNPEVFQAIREQILPYLDTYAHIKIWCAGCSTGEEPYSLAILLDEYGILRKTQIYATDINPFVIAEAKNGLFTEDALDANTQNYHASGGTGNFQDYFERNSRILKIHQRLRERILFFQHSLVNSGILNEFQLILCRNVLIYFNATLQRTVLRLFSDSLSRNGFLILGESENLTMHGDVDQTPGQYAWQLNEYDKKHKIYRKRKRSA